MRAGSPVAQGDFHLARGHAANAHRRRVSGNRDSDADGGGGGVMHGSTPRIGWDSWFCAGPWARGYPFS